MAEFLAYSGGGMKREGGREEESKREREGKIIKMVTLIIMLSDF